MAITQARKHKSDRAVVLSQMRDDWWQLHRAMQAKRPEAVQWRLQRIQKNRGLYQVTLAEMLVVSGSLR